MSTPYPSERERAAIQRHADAGDKSAREYLELLDACMQVLEASNGITLARGMVCMGKPLTMRSLILCR